MKHGLLLILLGCLVAFNTQAQHSPKVAKKLPVQSAHQSRQSGTFIYTLTTLNEPYNDLSGAISINNGELWDDPTYVVPIAFPFELNGNVISSLEFFGVGAFLSSPTSDPDVITAVFPFEMDMIDRGETAGESQSPLSYKLEGPAGSRILKIEWNNAGSYNEYFDGTQNMFINLQLWLYEGSNTIEFRFGDSFVDDPELFYGGEGTFMGVTDYDENAEVLYNGHFFSGTTDMPVLSASDVTIEGTPASGTVYRLSIDLPIELTVTGVNSTSTCDPNGSATAEVTGGTEPYTYTWNTGETTQTITNLDAGTYMVTVTDFNGGTATGNVTISNVSPLNPNAGSTDETFVEGNDGTATAATFGGLAPYTYLWSNGETTQMIINLAPGIYTVVVTDLAGCTASQSVTVNAFGCPEIEITPFITHASCFGLCDGSITLDIVGGAGPYTYIWSNGLASADALNLCESLYSVTVIDVNGCIVSGGPYEILQPTILFANAGASPETAQDANDGIAWSAPSGGTPPYTYAWSNSSVDSLISGLMPGIYTVTVTDDHLCTAVETVEVDSFACSLVFEITDNTCFQACDGGIEVSLINALSPIDYIWSNGDTLSTLTGLCAGIYDVTATDAAGCVSTGSYVVTQPDELVANATGTDESAPGANDGSAWATPTGGTLPYAYEWSNGSTDSLITNLFPWVYTVIVTDALGCQDTQNIIINTFPCLGIVESNSTPASCFALCDGDAGVGVIGGVGPFNFDWNTGDTSNVVTNLCAGIYDVTITDEGQNCVRVFTFEITEPEPIILAIDQIVNITDTTVGGISITVSGGALPYDFDWTGPNGFTSDEEDLNNLAAGPYDLSVSDANGCIVSESYLVIDERVSTTRLVNVDVRLFPNPANETVYIDIEDISGFEVQLRSLDGRVVGKWKEEKTLDIRSMPAGVYLLEGISGQKIFRQKVMIVR